MSQHKFAPITSSLLARKGEAGPSAVAIPGKMPFAWAARASLDGDVSAFESAYFPPADIAPPPRPKRQAETDSTGPRCPPPEKPRKMTITLSSRQHEVLGILAVKQNITRHQAARAALEAYIDRLADDYRGRCDCIAEGACCEGCGTG